MKNKKIRDVLRFFERYLTPQEALWLVQDCLNITHESICLHMEKEIPEEYTQKIDLLSHEVKRGKPFSYLIGNHFFMGEQFFVSPDTLIPRPETETLIIEAYKHLSPKKKEQKILELGTGSGIISIVLKKKTSATSHLRHRSISSSFADSPSKRPLSQCVHSLFRRPLVRCHWASTI